MLYNYFMWSDNKYVNTIINVLLFLIGVNVFHYGQLLLPIISLILFIDNRFKFNIKNRTVFVILCLFGISFFIFTYKLGFYSVMGMCLPMAYYIGSNLKNSSENNVINVIYLLTFGMATHVVLNFAYEYFMLGSAIFNKIHHYDIWTKEQISTTGTAINYVFIIGILYYVVFYERNRLIKFLSCIISIILFIYNFALGRRTPILMLGLAFVIGYILDIFVYKNRKVNKKLLIIISSILFVTIALITTLYVIDFNGFRMKFILVNLMLKFYNFGLNPERLQIFIEGVKLAPNYLWGGQYISTIMDCQIHDLWMDVYDYAGIIPFVLLIIYTIIVTKESYKTIHTKIERKVLFIPLIICIIIQLFLEPIITGSSIFLICVVIVLSALQNINN